MTRPLIRIHPTGNGEEPTRGTAPPFAIGIAGPTTGDAGEDHDGEKNKREHQRNREAGIEFRDGERLIENLGRSPPREASRRTRRK